MIQPVYQYGTSNPITSSTLLYTGPGVLEGVVVSSHSSGTIKFWDNTAGSGTVLVDTYTYPAGSSYINMFGAKFLTGLYADMNSTTQKVTVIWNAFVGA